MACRGQIDCNKTGHNCLCHSRIYTLLSVTVCSEMYTVTCFHMYLFVEMYFLMLF